MAYELHIERDSPILPDEWIAAVESSTGVRLAGAAEVEAQNPFTGERIALARSALDAEVLLGGAWIRLFRFGRRGAVSFRPSPRFDDDEDELRRLVRRLAAALAARVVGDEGELYE